MNILFFVGVYPDLKGYQGGVFIHNQAMALKKLGHNVAVMYLDFRSLKNNRIIGREMYYLDDIPVYRISFPSGPIYPLIRTVSPILSKSQYKHIEKKWGKIDVICVHFGNMAAYAECIKKMYGVPYIVVEHDSAILTKSITQKQLERQKRGYDGANAVIAVSAALKNELQKITKHQVEIIHNIVPDYMFVKNNRIKSNDEEFCFISVGNLKKSKAFDLTIKAFSHVVKNNKNVKLIIVGSGSEEMYLKELTAKCNIEDKVEFAGTISNRKLPELLTRCDCFVLPSKFETFGVVYIEAMACGLPVIATKCGGPEEFINEMNGVLLETDTPMELARIMEKFVENHREYDKKGIALAVEKQFSAEVIGKKLERVIMEL